MVPARQLMSWNRTHWLSGQSYRQLPCELIVSRVGHCVFMPSTSIGIVFIYMGLFLSK